MNRRLVALIGSALLTLPVNAFAHDDSEDRPGKTHLGVDLDYAAVIEDGVIESGTGFGLRLGREFDAILLTVIPELGGSYHSFGSLDAAIYRGFLGARLRLGKVLEPGAYAHLGIGKLEVEGVEDYSRTAPTFDAGLSLDFTLIPVLDIGVHAGYALMFRDSDGPAFDWYVLGANAALVF